MSAVATAEECCKTRSALYPSGWHRTHSSTCPEYPNVKVGDENRRRVRPARIGSTEPHARCRDADSWGMQPCNRCAPLLHPAGHDCAACRYADHHSDDER